MSVPFLFFLFLYGPGVPIEHAREAERSDPGELDAEIEGELVR
jgi:hypothetical protein